MVIGMRAFALIATASALPGCNKSNAELSEVPVLSEPYEYEIKGDEFTGTGFLKAQRVALRPGILLKTAFYCQPSSSGAQVNPSENTYFAIAIQTGQGRNIVPARIRFKIDEQPPFDAVWNNDADPGQGLFIVPYSQLLAGGVSREERYSAAWAANMTPYLDNPFLLDLVEPTGEIDFNLIGKLGKEALARKATTAKRMMIRYAIAEGVEENVDINLNDPAIETVLSKCGWNLDAPAPGFSADSRIRKERRLTPEDLQMHSRDILLFTNTARSCHEDGKRDGCSDALDKLRELSEQGICPVGDPGRQVWGRCLAKAEN